MIGWYLGHKLISRINIVDTKQRCEEQKNKINKRPSSSIILSTGLVITIIIGGCGNL